jgi:hypothetical protein
MKKIYTDEFKNLARQLTQDGVPVPLAAKEIGVPKKTLQSWVDAETAGKKHAKAAIHDAPVATQAQGVHGLSGRVSYADAQTAKDLCGLTNAEFASYFGWTPITMLDLAKRPDSLLSPAHSMIVRHLIHQPEMCVMAPKPTFDSVLKRINEGVNIEAYSTEFGVRNKKVLSPRRLVLLMGMSLSAESRLGKGVAPSPIVSRVLQHLTRLMDTYGDAKGFDRFLDIARQEAAARGMTIAQVFDASRWRSKEEIEASKIDGVSKGEDGE